MHFSFNIIWHKGHPYTYQSLQFLTLFLLIACLALCLRVVTEGRPPWVSTRERTKSRFLKSTSTIRKRIAWTARGAFKCCPWHEETLSVHWGEWRGSLVGEPILKWFHIIMNAPIIGCLGKMGGWQFGFSSTGCSFLYYWTLKNFIIFCRI